MFAPKRYYKSEKEQKGIKTWRRIKSRTCKGSETADIVIRRVSVVLF